MKGPLLFHVSVALFVAGLVTLGHQPLLAAGVAAYAILVAFNRSSGLGDSIAYLACGAFTAGSLILAILSFDSGRYFVATVILTGLAASWAWTLLRVQKV